MQNMVKDKSLELIHKEFYLSKCRVQEIIYDNKEYLNEIIHRKPAVKWLDLEYPHVKWISPENTVNQ
ncbi:MAG TPA: hypothetical protein DDX39_12025 [Bacteroidales bacterium]|nr:MAG: hypothetical protein A2W98_11430 [Bacteroidetes bacterium GWF2_33_38]OFY92054.1 MAG: hypothetical protein A2236_08845 [Bacteroidetes bacterium RIFOXYA2_FULL_33_7]HBF89359.1 hypothetical protein [Bacteroidales bacterium]